MKSVLLKHTENEIEQGMLDLLKSILKESILIKRNTIAIVDYFYLLFRSVQKCYCSYYQYFQAYYVIITFIGKGENIRPVHAFQRSFQVYREFLGPTPLPFFGNILSVIKHEPGYEIFKKWRETYGPIYTYWLGESPVVMVSDYESIVELFVKDGETYTGRQKTPQWMNLVRGKSKRS